MLEINKNIAREFLVGHHGLKRLLHPKGREGAVELLNRLRCIQLDPLDVLATNADLEKTLLRHAKACGADEIEI
jgi:uncharacterized protein